LRNPRALKNWITAPRQSQPLKVIIDLLDEMRAAAGVINIVNPQNKSIAQPLCYRGRIGVPQMQLTCWTGGKSGYRRMFHLVLSAAFFIKDAHIFIKGAYTGLASRVGIILKTSLFCA
jgi:hypothetical protein